MCPWLYSTSPLIHVFQSQTHFCVITFVSSFFLVTLMQCPTEVIMHISISMYERSACKRAQLNPSIFPFCHFSFCTDRSALPNIVLQTKIKNKHTQGSSQYSYFIEVYCMPGLFLCRHKNVGHFYHQLKSKFLSHDWKSYFTLVLIGNISIFQAHFILTSVFSTLELNI